MFKLRKMIMRCVAAVLLSTSSAAVAKEEWKMTGIAPETSLYHILLVEKFAAHIEELSAGEINVKTFGGGTLAPATKLHDAVKSGVIESAITSPVYLTNSHPVNSYFGSHPGGMDGLTILAWYRVGGGQELVQKFRRETMGLHSILCGLGPAEVFMHSHKKVEDAGDLKGMKIRAAGAWAEILGEKFGGVPTSVPGSEVFTLLERKAIDAAEFSTMSDNINLGIHEAAPWIVVPGMHARAVPMELIVSADRWDSLSDQLKSKVNAACELTTIQSFLEWSKRDLDALAGLDEKDRSRVVRISDAMLAEVEAAGREWGETRAKDKAAAGDTFMRDYISAYYDFKKQWEGTSALRGE